MNERIKILAGEAGFHTAGNPEYFHAPRYDGICTEELEKFAMLIVKECLYTIQGAIVRNGPTPENKRSHKHLDDIAEKFGITFPI